MLTDHGVNVTPLFKMCILNIKSRWASEMYNTLFHKYTRRHVGVDSAPVSARHLEAVRLTRTTAAAATPAAVRITRV